MKMTDIEIVMTFDCHRREVGEIARASAMKYARRWGCKTHIIQVDEYPCPYQAKLTMIFERLKRNNYILWLDADALIYNCDFDLTPFLKISEHWPLIISQDKSGVCDGIMLIQQCTWTIKLFCAWEFLGLMKDRSAFGGDQRGQATLKLLLNNFPHLMEKIYKFDPDIVSNPNQPCPWANPFIHHYWATNKDQALVAKQMQKDFERCQTLLQHKS